MLHHRVPSCLLGALPVCVAGTAAWAQVASRISGTVRDSSDAVVNGAKVTVEDVDRGIATSTLSNEAGRYSFPNMVVGRYR